MTMWVACDIRTKNRNDAMKLIASTAVIVLFSLGTRFSLGALACLLTETPVGSLVTLVSRVKSFKFIISYSVFSLTISYGMKVGRSGFIFLTMNFVM